MSLSEDILIGNSLVKCNPDIWISDDGSCGCAFAGALVARGLASEFIRERARLLSSGSIGYIYYPVEIDCVRRTWPWLTEWHLREITHLHRAFARGEGTIEQIADYVRSIEPADEPEPEPIEAEWSDADTERERYNSITGRG